MCRDAIQSVQRGNVDVNEHNGERRDALCPNLSPTHRVVQTSGENPGQAPNPTTHFDRCTCPRNTPNVVRFQNIE